MVEFSSQVLRVFIVTKVKEITEASASVGLLLATVVKANEVRNIRDEIKCGIQDDFFHHYEINTIKEF